MVPGSGFRYSSAALADPAAVVAAGPPSRDVMGMNPLVAGESSQKALGSLKNAKIVDFAKNRNQSCLVAIENTWRVVHSQWCCLAVIETDGDSWLTWLFRNLPPSISQRDTYDTDPILKGHGD